MPERLEGDTDRISTDLIMSLISLGVTLPFAMKHISARKNKYFRILGAAGIGAAMLFEINALELERERLKRQREGTS